MNGRRSEQRLWSLGCPSFESHYNGSTLNVRPPPKVQRRVYTVTNGTKENPYRENMIVVKESFMILIKNDVKFQELVY